jgi:hypothetical protein
MAEIGELDTLGRFWVYIYAVDVKSAWATINFPRLTVSALIIKHMEQIDDRRVVAALEENTYMWKFLNDFLGIYICKQF